MVRKTRTLAGVLALGAALVLPASGAEARPQEVDVSEGRFSPAEVRVDVDETVRWIVRDEEHTITSDDGLFDSGPAGPGSIYVARFRNPGRYKYYCSIHGGPGGQGMSGIVVVRGKAKSPEPEEGTTTTQPAPPPSPPPTTSPPTTVPSPPPPPPAPTPPAPPAQAAAAAPTTTTTARPATTTTLAPTTTTTVAPPETTTTTAPPPPPPPAPPPSQSFAAGPVPEVPDGEADLYRVNREASQKRLATVSHEADDRGNDALVVVGGGILVVAGLVLVVPGWRTNRPQRIRA
jgi:plastocyanin